MSQSSLILIVDPMYDTYANNVAAKGSLNLHQSIEHIDDYSITDRIANAWKYAKLGTHYLHSIFKSEDEQKDVFGFTYGLTRVERVKLFLRTIWYGFKFTPATTEHVKKNKQRLQCNESQLNQITKGSLEWSDAACVLKYDQLERVEQTVLQKMLNASKPTPPANKYWNG